MLEEVGRDYVRTARAKGLSERLILFKHVLKNAMIPILTRTVLAIPFLFMGSLLLERFFGIPGLGALTVEAVTSGDTKVLVAIVYLGALLFAAGNLATDISYTLVDPRVRLG
jgi:peptide/nickel transport system permease protein